MDDMNDMLSSILSDPESMQQIKELADMLKAESGNDSPGGGQEQPSGGSGDGGMSALMGLLGNMGGGDGGSPINADMLGMLSTLMTAAGGEDKNRSLLLALRPHLSGDKQVKLDKAVKMLKIYSMAQALKDSGLLGSIDKLI